MGNNRRNYKRMNDEDELDFRPRKRVRQRGHCTGIEDGLSPEELRRVISQYKYNVDYNDNDEEIAS
jgi:hypothetical protein